MAIFANKKPYGVAAADALSLSSGLAASGAEAPTFVSFFVSSAQVEQILLLLSTSDLLASVQKMKVC